MKKTRFTDEQMVTILREVDQRPVPEVAKRHGGSAQTIYSRRKHFGTLEPADVKRLRQLEQENGQTDFTYLPVVGWGWYYLSTVLDDYSRCILAWLLRTSMQAGDVTETLDLARARTGVDRVQSPTVARVARQRHPRRRLPRPATGHPGPAGTDQAADVAAATTGESEDAASSGTTAGGVSSLTAPVVHTHLTTYTVTCCARRIIGNYEVARSSFGMQSRSPPDSS